MAQGPAAGWPQADCCRFCSSLAFIEYFSLFPFRACPLLVCPLTSIRTDTAHRGARRHSDIAELESGPRISGSQPRVLARGPGCLAGERAQPLFIPPCPAEEDPAQRSPMECPSAVMLWGPQGQLSRGRPLSACSARDFGANSPLLLSSLPTATWTLDASTGEGAFSDSQQHLYSFLQSVCEPHPRGSWAQGPEVLLAIPTCPLALCPEPWGRMAVRGRREAGRGPPTSSGSPHLEGSP